MYEQGTRSRLRNPNITKKSGTFGNYENSGNNYIYQVLPYHFSSNVQPENNQIQIIQITLSNGDQCNVNEFREIAQLRYRNKEAVRILIRDYLRQNCESCRSMKAMIQKSERVFNALCEIVRQTPVITSQILDQINKEFNPLNKNFIIKMLIQNLKFHLVKSNKNLALEKISTKQLKQVRLKQIVQYQKQIKHQKQVTKAETENENIRKLQQKQHMIAKMRQVMLQVIHELQGKLSQKNQEITQLKTDIRLNYLMNQHQ